MDMSEIRYMSATTLLVRPAPIDGESWGGYLLRLSASNGMRGIENIASGQGKKWRQLLGGEPQDVLQSFGIPWTPNQPHVGYKPLKSTKSERLSALGQAETFKVCPLCMANDGHTSFIRADWDSPIIHKCAIHKVALISTCQECGKTLSYQQCSHIKCDCGSFYKDQTPQPIPAHYGEFERIFAEAYSLKSKVTFERLTKIEQDASTICKWLVEPIDASTKRRKANCRQKGRHMTVSTPNAIEPLLADWPNVAVTAIKMEVNMTALNPMWFLQRRLMTPVFCAMRELVKATTLQIDADNAVLQPNIELENPLVVKSTYSLSDLYKVTGIAHDFLRKLCASGYIPDATVEPGENIWHRKVDIPAHAYKLIADTYQATLSIDDAANQVGCSIDSIRGLVRSQCISSYSLSPSLRKFQRIYPDALRKILDELAQQASVNPDIPCESRIKFSDWVSGTYSVQTSPHWRKVLDAVLNGKVPLHKSVTKVVRLDDLYMTPADLRFAYRST